MRSLRIAAFSPQLSSWARMSSSVGGSVSLLALPKHTRRFFSGDSINSRIEAEIAERFDEEFELEYDDDRLDALVDLEGKRSKEGKLPRGVYFKELFRLQAELVKLQDWVEHKKLKVVVLFEGRDAAGKGGAIKRLTQRLNPRVCRVTALGVPTEREKSQWYFQRYVEHLPSGGEIVLFDRSWYNRAGVERVMGFTPEEDVQEFMRTVPDFERMLVKSGIILIKYWFSISDEEQHLRFLMRVHDPMKQWKLSPMDLESRKRWEIYTAAKEEMMKKTHIPEAKWWIVEGNNKKRARLNCISHFLSQIPYEDVPHDAIKLPDREHNPEYERHDLPADMHVPDLFPTK